MTIIEREVVEAPAVAPVTTRDVLHRAADLLEEFGHCKFRPAVTACGFACQPDDNGATAFCLTGAIERAVLDLTGTPARLGDGWNPDALPILYPISRALLGVGVPREQPAWNNAEGRTREEVIARLREAAQTAA